jgi:hypothetical protein
MVDPSAREQKSVTHAAMKDGVKLKMNHYYLLVVGSGQKEDAQAAVMREAAKSGVPFCEECEKLRREQQRA